MCRTIKLSALAACLLLVHSSPLFADSYRCGQKLIRVGDTKRDVLRTCGEPDYKDRGIEQIKIDGTTRSTSVQRWYYKKSRRSLERVVLIYKGRVRGIEVGSR